MSEPIENFEQLPVAWMTENGTIFDELPPISGGLIPLYTHPMRELTDEDIWKCHAETNTNNWVIDFARAIIKASRGEK
jgi:hypothetical protein